MEKKVAILMASYNGENYIEKQINSIIDQTYQDWELFIRDDGSIDSTVQIIENFVARDQRIHLIKSDSDYHGAFVNFHYLINSMKDAPLFDYYYYCDQDDIWMKNKIEMMNSSFNKEGIPELIYSDMAIIDGNDNIIVPSNNADRSIELPNNKQLYFTHSYIWGCAVAFNQELFELVPKVNINSDIKIINILSHDNYYAKFALEYGKVTYLNQPLIKYRRHFNNVSVISKAKVGLKDIIKMSLTDYLKIVELHANGYIQTLYMIRIAREIGLENNKLNDIEKVIRSGGWKAVSYLIKNRIKKNQPSKTYFFQTDVVLNIFVPFPS